MAEEECAGQGSFFFFFFKMYILAADEIDLEEEGKLLIQKKGQTTDQWISWDVMRLAIRWRGCHCLECGQPVLAGDTGLRLLNPLEEASHTER